MIEGVSFRGVVFQGVGAVTARVLLLVLSCHSVLRYKAPPPPTRSRDCSVVSEGVDPSIYRLVDACALQFYYANVGSTLYQAVDFHALCVCTCVRARVCVYVSMCVFCVRLCTVCCGTWLPSRQRLPCILNTAVSSHPGRRLTVTDMAGSLHHFQKVSSKRWRTTKPAVGLDRTRLVRPWEHGGLPGTQVRLVIRLLPCRIYLPPESYLRNVLWFYPIIGRSHRCLVS